MTPTPAPGTPAAPSATATRAATAARCGTPGRGRRTPCPVRGVRVTDPTAVVQVRAATGEWVAVCAYGELEPARGRVAKLPDGSQAALFRDAAGAVHAVGNRDPFSGLLVIANGITGSVDGVPVVASPLDKQVFDLRTGRCLDRPDDPGARLPVLPVRIGR